MQSVTCLKKQPYQNFTSSSVLLRYSSDYNFTIHETLFIKNQPKQAT